MYSIVNSVYNIKIIIKIKLQNFFFLNDPMWSLDNKFFGVGSALF